MSRARYKIDIYNAGVVSTTGTIAFTLQSSQLTNGAPTAGGYLVRPTLGRVEGQPWSFSPLDVSSTFTSHLASTAGRLNLLGRLVRFRRSLDSTASTAYQTQTAGRISDVILDPSVASYTVTVSDERILERESRIFTKLTDSLAIIPGGLVSNAPQYLLTYPGGTIEWTCRKQLGNLVLLEMTDSNGAGSFGQPVVDFVSQDYSGNSLFPLNNPSAATVGNWKTLRWKNVITTTNYEIAAIGFQRISATADYAFPQYPFSGVVEMVSGAKRPAIWVVWVTSPPAVNARVYGYVHASGATPCEGAPLFVGGVNGLHPGALARAIYNNTYGDATNPTIRISTGAFDTWEADPSYGRVSFRLKAPENMSDFLEKRLYQPYGMVPAPDSSGKISPTSILCPSSNGLTLASLLTLTSTNLASHPTWSQLGRECVNALTMGFENIGKDVSGFVGAPNQTFGPMTWQSADRLAQTSQFVRLNHDTITAVGRRELDIKYGMVSVMLQHSTGTTGLSIPPDAIMARFGQSIFDRFGDGPLYSDAVGMASVDTSTLGRVRAGQFVKVKLGTFPNPGTQARGSTRVMQVVQRSDPLGTPSLTLLDLGPSQSAVGVPTIAMTASSFTSRHGVKVVVGSLDAGAKYQVRFAPTSTGAAAPSSGSSMWRMVLTGSSTGLTQHVMRLASKRKWYGEVRATKPGRINSAWSAASNAVTASITAPSGLSASVITNGAALLKWTYGSSLYGTEVMVSDSTNDGLGSSRAVARVWPLSTRYNLRGLTTGANHRAGVRHFDAYGGFSAMAATTVLASTATAQAPKPKGITIVQGRP